MSDAPDTTTLEPVPPSPAAQPTFLDRALDNLRTRWREIAASARGAVGAPPRTHLPKEDAERLKEQIEACLESRGGEVSARARAAQLGRTYLALDPQGRRNFLMMLARDFDVDREAVTEAMATFQAAADPVARGHAERALRRALEPPRLRLLTQFNALPEGVKFLVDLRAELMEMARDEPLLQALEDDLKNLLRAWFDVGFLEMHRITWDSPASLLERLIKYEAVHEISGWQDLKDRLDSDRRCFAFFHPRMPNEPLIFVEVALVQGMSDNVQALLDPSAPVCDPKSADSAIFYSISNAQSGLAGISFGNFLIKRVVDGLATEFPNIKCYATLSPIPGFRRWLDRTLERDGDAVLTSAEAERLAGRLAELEAAASGGPAQDEAPDESPLLARALARPGWHEDEDLQTLLRGPLMRICVRYLTTVLTTGHGRPRALDPVAHFHLTNGARMERLNWLADRQPKGLQQSLGMMINYRYRLGEIDTNHEAYSGDGRIIASSAVRALGKAG
ncbi:malonyl-CoA decarboxylase [Azospirillum picis]|uniref:Malonyl-CoA decarboxylase n=1 Tax=Azospirillum picis TaxID=488438 RepID=A0ABU0ME63_9PROT|nr:malonyl-CoA decarboxylase [Azospirillum picis]MBP2297856.1 malonyl-CoA decarboxylase [Azospirillum picis]MDQ0531694.1 malonyl-CoA decarboxylase [Azospirillum picis]